MSKKKKKMSTVNIVLIIELVVMLLLTLLITKIVSSRTRQSSLDHMATITEERAHIIESYIENAEKTLSAYARAGQITDLLLNPKDPAAKTAAQKYTEKFSGDIPDLEGIYVSEWNTHVLAHTDKSVVGIITRKEEGPLKQLHDAMLAASPGVYDTGIIISPASGKQIVSMYMAVMDDNNEPIGLVGLGLYTDGLINTLNKLQIRGIDTSFYSMVNTADNKYIFNPDKSLVSTVTEQPEILTLCKEIGKDPKNYSGNFEYKYDDDKYISTYTYMKEYGWILMLDAAKSEIYRLSISMRVFFAIIGLLMLGLVVMFHLINKKQEQIVEKLSTQILRNEKTKESLETAMFRDILTDVSNRVSFTMDAERLEPNQEFPYYFVMLNISDFSDINIRYGNDIGDQVLRATVETLKKVFPNGNVYRTGSDEFVVMIQVENNTTGYNSVINNVNTAHAALLASLETSAGPINADYKIAVAKKSEGIDASIISTLKDMTNRTGNAVFGQVQFVDLDLR